LLHKKLVMKTKQVTLMLLALVFAISASATETPKMNVVAIDNSKALIAAETSPKVSAEISILSENGEVVYYKKSKAAAQFKSVLDLSELNDGVYTVQLKTGEKSVKRELEVSNGKIAVKAMKRYLDPVFTYDGKMVTLSFLNFEQENVSLKVYKGSKMLFETKLGNSFKIQRAFDVSKMEMGEFDFVLNGADNYYAYKIDR